MAGPRGIFGAIFDMDGVLVDNASFHYRAWRQILRSRGITLTREEYDHSLNGKTPQETAKAIYGEGISPVGVRELNDRKESVYRSLYRGEVAPAPGLLRLLRELDSAGVPMALATSAEPENIEMVLAGTGTREFFPVIVDATMVRRGKPDPEIFRKAAALLGREPERCVVFEDSRLGLAAARACGAKVVAVATTLPVEQITDADMIIRDFTDLELAGLSRLFEGIEAEG
ncbi:MAG: beta-phosphoglucomutase family hydrolase [Spirochaetales bacterium]|nr:beta-phosphoglucomutase family hydrolase [Spirochaetales bacterium]